MINSSQDNADVNNLLNQLKLKHKKQQATDQVSSHSHKNSIDKLLGQVKSELSNQQKKESRELTHPQADQESNKNLEDLKQQLQAKKQQIVQQKPQQSPGIDNNLGTFKQQFQHKQQEQIQTSTHRNQEEIRYAEQRKQQQQKLLVRRAEKWLNELDKYSDEGSWFEEFAYSYPSRLEAAIEYLSILENPS